ncbi:MAG: hypothetical protein M5R36_16755 [Deltaproteobacteria bacterium]|nr:hypothetical protein [Deltaproteobacteria bacterium]
MRNRSARSAVFGFAYLLAILGASLLGTIGCGCGDDDDDSDAASDDDDTVSDDDLVDDDEDDDTDDDDSEDGWDNLSDELGDGEVRAGRITAEDELIGGPRARGEIGDYKIYNARIELIVRAPEHPGVGLSTYSGNIIDADRARPQGEPGADSLLNIEHIIGLVRAFVPETIEVVEDGRDGRAVIRVTGTDGGINFVDSFVLTGDKPTGIVNEYILEPDKDYVVIRTTVLNETDRERTVILAEMPFWRGFMDVFTPRTGLEADAVDPSPISDGSAAKAVSASRFHTDSRRRRPRRASLHRTFTAT